MTGEGFSWAAWSRGVFGNSKGISLNPGSLFRRQVRSGERTIALARGQGFDAAPQNVVQW